MKPFHFLIGLLLLKALVLGCVIAFYPAGLSPDEAQYWTWSQALDWGYYSKPPGIAWQIGASSALLGNTVLGVRFGALVIAFFLALAVYYLARQVNLNEKTAFWAGVAMAFSPLGVYLSLAATTDGGAILFLVLGIAAAVRCNYPMAGVWILFGALYKWTAFALWPFTLVFLLFFPSMRRWSIIWGILISLVALLPPVYWNLAHDWVTFKHVAGALGTAPRANFFDFLGAQIGLLSPIFFVLLLLAYVRLVKSRERSLLFCAAFPFAILFYLGAALFNKIQPNWAAYLMPPAMVLIAWAAYARHRLWLHIGVWVSIATVCAAFFVPWIAFRHSLGWDRLAPALEQAGYDPQTDFLMGEKYQAASLLSFYSPEQKRAYFFNVGGTRKNQFSFWPQMEESEIGKSGYFVVIEKAKLEAHQWYESHYTERLAPYFESVSFVGAYPLYFVDGKPVKEALIFKCEGYLGGAPADPEVY